MLARLSNLIWGSEIQQQRDPNAVKSQSSDTVKESFLARLEKIKYTGKIPDYFICPVSLEIMEDPWIVNKHESHVFDKVCLDKHLQIKASVDPFNTTIVTKEAHTHLKHQIEEFVSCLERIHTLEQKLEIYTHENADEGNTTESTLTVKHLKELLSDTEGRSLTENHLVQLLKEQNDEQNRNIIQTKLMLAIELQVFISLTESVISVEDKKKEEKLVELQEVNGSKLVLLNILRNELASHYPDIFPKQYIILELDEDLPQQDPGKSNNPASSNGEGEKVIDEKSGNVSEKEQDEESLRQGTGINANQEASAPHRPVFFRHFPASGSMAYTNNQNIFIYASLPFLYQPLLFNMAMQQRDLSRQARIHHPPHHVHPAIDDIDDESVANTGSVRLGYNGSQ